MFGARSVDADKDERFSVHGHLSLAVAPSRRTVPCTGARGCEQPRRDSPLGVQHGRPTEAGVPQVLAGTGGARLRLNQPAGHGYDAS